MNVDDLKERVSAAYADREKAKEPFYAMAIRETLNLVERGFANLDYRDSLAAAQPRAGWQHVRVTFLRTGGGAAIEKQYTIPANSRFNVDVAGMVPELANQEFGAIVEVIAGAPVIVERALYSNSGGVLFAAGTASPAVRLP